MTLIHCSRIAKLLEGESFTASGDQWSIYVFDITRDEHAWFLHIALIGRRDTHSVTVEIDDGCEHGVAAALVLRRLREWLAFDIHADDESSPPSHRPVTNSTFYEE